MQFIVCFYIEAKDLETAKKILRNSKINSFAIGGIEEQPFDLITELFKIKEGKF